MDFEIIIDYLAVDPEGLVLRAESEENLKGTIGCFVELHKV